ncbi:MAG: glycoside hydrolase family 13 protein [Treponemataceae bacterium]|nr:glycoside hydrolase family 13 protein [Treponemataceae bacterium]
MNVAAVQHCAFDGFCYALDSDALEINLVTGKDIGRVFLIYGDPFMGGILGGNFVWKGEELEMTERAELQAHFRWTAVIRPPFKRARYYFRLVSGGEEVFFLESGFFTPEEFGRFKEFHGCFTFPWMNPADICAPPEWAERTVWYQIFPSRFCRGRSDFVPEGMKPWGRLGERAERDDVFGGNIQGIIDRIGYLRQLGITGLYLTPVNEAASQHKYDTTDYLSVDRSFGTNGTLRELVAEAHRAGIRVILDGVFNHSGWAFFAWQDVLANRQKSEYADWFCINDFDFCEPGVSPERSNAGAGKFYTFAFCDFMPKLNTNNPAVRNYIIGVCETWVREYGIDGLRLDVANEISHAFCRELRARMTALKDDFYIVGEIWHNAMPWLRGQEFDSVMNYPLQDCIADFCLDGRMPVKALEWAVNRCYSMYSRQTNRVLFNQMDSHDTIRIVSRFGGNKRRAVQALALLFAMPGSVCIYYGTEVLLEGGFDPDNRRCMPWQEIDGGVFDRELAFFRSLIALRKSHPALCSTRMSFLYDGADGEGRNRVVRLVKTAERGDGESGAAETLLLAANFGTAEFQLDAEAAAGRVLLSEGLDGGAVAADGFALIQLR